MDLISKRKKVFHLSKYVIKQVTEQRFTFIFFKQLSLFIFNLIHTYIYKIFINQIAVIIDTKSLYLPSQSIVILYAIARDF